MRIVLDTNIWISYLLSPHLSWLDHFFKNPEFHLLFSEQLLSEFLRVAKKPKLQKYFSDKQLTDLLLRFEEYGVMIDVHSNYELCRDPDDNFLLNLAVDGHANFLVSGDDDLLVLGKIDTCQIISLTQLKEHIS
ncbi:putative toxin-antitoxin system toxin component, PIN family [Owenweeksia hongkongensis DSM 17368]|uniref:Putative toxin-antitoxin system toxin component, PIN family n=1 Tax=Owenweeksia hongkongensis (strain DSM 17368 / CIP 108786 / JCM 12287 / NRRL B-23963 / UST20020801) TaxID=926562 RepID=G8R3E7_OWEHD|nr:putative toxin-antitoxin system toxin component, PIN family [Owenweeksia hongkongensis]AEV31968.1 putative toxin-antitoxin system toxin component, PIN family [Owenweeksia hongkongensis DSM 17368]